MLTVSFSSQFLDVAMTLFGEAFEHADFATSITASNTRCHFQFKDDKLLRDLRGWVADAMGCGLIVLGGVQPS